MSHTPGPWGLCFHLRSHENDHSCTCGYRGSIWSCDGESIICEMGSSPDVDDKGVVQGHTMPMRDRASQLADARLIAAAPDMSEALKPFAEAVENLNDDHPDGSHIWESPAAMSLTAGDLRRALAALTKAQGLSPEREEA